MNKDRYCDACGDFITSTEPYTVVTMKENEGKTERYTLCDVCSDDLRARIDNNELLITY